MRGVRMRSKRTRYLGPFKVPVLRQRIERDGEMAAGESGSISTTLTGLSVSGTRSRSSLVMTSGGRILRVKPKFTHPPPGVVVDGVDCPLLHARLREEVEDCFVQYFGFSVTGHVVPPYCQVIWLLLGCYCAPGYHTGQKAMTFVAESVLIGTRTRDHADNSCRIGRACVAGRNTIFS
jgi:hypothetical protein